VLTEAALQAAPTSCGAEGDVIIGKLIPAGTGRIRTRWCSRSSPALPCLAPKASSGRRAPGPKSRHAGQPGGMAGLAGRPARSRRGGRRGPGGGEEAAGEGLTLEADEGEESGADSE